jgi:hypothetical protein
MGFLGIGATLSFFVRTSDEILYDGLQLIDDTRKERKIPWWQKDYDGNIIEEENIFPKLKCSVVEPRYIWSAVTICVLFRTPYLQELTKCLELSYHSAIASKVVEWETSRDVFLQSYGMSKEQQLLPSCFYQANRQELLSKFPPFHINMENLFCFLCIECPVPIPKLLHVTVTLQSPHISAQLEGICLPGAQPACPVEEMTVKFHPQDPSAFPRSPFSISKTLDLFGPRALIDVLCCILSEARILFHSTDLGKLSQITECFRTLMYPLTWTHVYLPVVPVQLLNLIEAPVPFILGTHSENIKHINSCYLSEVVVVDCDGGSLDRHGAVILRFPEKEDRWLIMALSHLQVHDDVKTTHRIQCCLPREDQTDDLRDIEIQVIIFDVLVQLLRYIPECLFYLNSACPIFNRPLFLSEYCVEDYRNMLELLTVTNAFHTLTETFQSESMKFFFDSVERLKACERNIAVQTMQENQSVPKISLEMSQVEMMKDGVEEILNDHACSLDEFPRSIRNDSSNISFKSPSQSLQRIFSFRTQNRASNGGIHATNQLEISSSSTPSLLQSLDSPPFLSKTGSVARSSNRRTSFTSAGINQGENDIVDIKSLSLNQTTPKSVISSPNIMEFRFNFLPKWAVNIFVENAAASQRMIYSIFDMVNYRLNQYIPYINSNSSNEPNNLEDNLINLRFLVPITVQCESETSYEQQDIDVADPSLPNDGETNKTTPEDHNLMSNNVKEHCANDEENSILAFFSKEIVLSCQSASKHWNIMRISEVINKDLDELIKIFRISPHSVIFDEAAISKSEVSAGISVPIDEHQADTSVPPSTPVGQRYIQRNLMSHALVNHHQYIQNSAFGHKSGFNQQQYGTRVDELIEQFLQKIITMYDLDDSFVDAALGQCQQSLRDASNRKGIVNILRQSRKQEMHGNKETNIYPLNSCAFQAFSKLFNMMLGICLEQEDFVTAFELLEVGGHYFRIIVNPFSDDGVQHVDYGFGGDEEEDSIEFLSEKVCHHPIFQTPALWKSIMHHRLPLNLLLSSTSSPSSKLTRGKEAPFNKTHSSKLNKMAMTAVMTEIRSILYMMLGMGVSIIHF